MDIGVPYLVVEYSLFYIPKYGPMSIDQYSIVYAFESPIPGKRKGLTLETLVMTLNPDSQWLRTLDILSNPTLQNLHPELYIPTGAFLGRAHPFPGCLDPELYPAIHTIAWS